LCEIDGMVVESCRKYLSSIAAGALDDKRATVLIEDGVKYIEKNKRAFDVILVDSTDPVNMASPLTRLSFFRAAREALRPGGVYATQSQGPIFEVKGLRRISRTIRKAFRGVDYYLAGVPTYPGGVWSFAIATPDGSSPAKRTPRPVPKTMKMHYYSRELHRALFTLPVFVQELTR
ncbi:MAG: spermidine synthase, partial [bacterium]|nr:spermidine synthase [bacterium]